MNRELVVSIARELFDAQNFERWPRGFQSVSVRRQFRVGDERIRAGIVHDVTHLGRFKEIVDGHDHAAGRQNAEHR